MRRRKSFTRAGAILLAVSMLVGDTLPTMASSAATDSLAVETVTDTDEYTEEPEESSTDEVSTEAQESAAGGEAEETEEAEATETNAGAEESAASEETKASAETTDAKTEASEETEAVETTEKSEASEETEEKSEEAEAEVLEDAETIEEIETPGEAAEKEASEESEIIGEEEHLLGSAVGVSTVIGLEGYSYYDGTFYSDDDSVTKGYTYVNQLDDNRVSVFGSTTAYLDATTGLYKYNDTYYSYTYTSSSYAYLSGKVAYYTTAVPQRDTTTGLYQANGKYYAYYSSTSNGYYYFEESDEAVYLGTVSSTADVSAAYGQKIVSTDESYRYYAVNGSYYRYINSRTVSAGLAVWAYKTNEISFEKKHHSISWNAVTNETELVSDGGKIYYIGYQVLVNGAAAQLGYTATDASTFTKNNYYDSSVAYSAGEVVTYQVRAIYYTETTDASTGITSYTIAKTGDWSAAITYYFTADAARKTVSQVTGLSANRKSYSTVELSWTAVAEASTYYVEILESSTAITDLNSESVWDYADTVYVSASKTYYQDQLSSKYTYYRVRAYANNSEETYVSAYGDYSIVKTVEKSDTVTLNTVTGVAVENNTDGTFTLTWDHADGANTRVYYSKDSTVFNTTAYLWSLARPRDTDGDYYYNDDSVNEAYQVANKLVSYYDTDASATEVSSDDLGLEVGSKYYFVVVTYDSSNYSTNREDATPYSITSGSTTTKYGYYYDISAPTAAVSGTVSLMSEISSPTITSEKTSITMNFGKSSNITAYQIYRANSKGKYQKIATTTSGVYTDSDLAEDTTYKYKARAYYYNTVTKKTIYSDYVFFSAETSTKNYINVTAVMSGKTSVKVKWTKVTGAEKYEVYRCNTSSVSTEYSKDNGTGNYAYSLGNSKWHLVKTVSNAKTVSYTDKKLTAGSSYSYKVVAYYTSGKTTEQIYDTASVTLAVTAPVNVTTKISGSTVKVTWGADKYASKYQVRYKVYNAQGKATKDEWTEISAKKTSASIKNIAVGGYVTLQVRAYDGKKWSSWSGSVTQKRYLSNVTSVKAVNTTTKDDEGTETAQVKITWKKVSSAAYYRVYRATTPAVTYNSDDKYYYLPTDATVIVKESNTDETYSTVSFTEYKGQSGTIVGTSAIDGGQLESGVTYYYYVYAYAENGTAVSQGVSASGTGSVVFNATVSIKGVTAAKGKTTVTINKVTGATKYIVYRSTKKKSGYTEIGTTKTTKYVDKTTKKGKTYYYKVVAVGTNGLKADFTTEKSSAVKVKAK